MAPLNEEQRQSKVALRRLLQRKMHSLQDSSADVYIRLKSAIAAIDAQLGVNSSASTKRRRSQLKDDGKNLSKKDSNNSKNNGVCDVPRKKKKTRINKKGDKKQTRFLNQQVAQHAQSKQLNKALEAFQKGVKRGIADVHTYTSMINAFVRCDQIIEAEKIMDSMWLAGVKPNVVTYTALIKGFCSSRMMDSAGAAMRKMITDSPPIIPNVRTCNTYLRGCIREGCVEEAEWLIAQMLSLWDITPDATSYESCITLLCQGLKLREAKGLVYQLRDTLDSREDTMSNGALYIALARSAALLGNWSVCEESLKQAKCALETASSFTRRAFRTGDGLTRAVQGRSNRFRGRGRGSGRQITQSARLFDKHKREELTRDYAIIDNFLQATKKRLSIQLPNIHIAAHYNSVLSFYRRVFLFNARDDHQNELEEKLHKSFQIECTFYKNF